MLLGSLDVVLATWADVVLVRAALHAAVALWIWSLGGCGLVRVAAALLADLQAAVGSLMVRDDHAFIN